MHGPTGGVVGHHGCGQQDQGAGTEQEQPVQIATLAAEINQAGGVLEELGPSAQPGDVYIANDPYGCGGQHLPDIYLIKPVLKIRSEAFHER